MTVRAAMLLLTTASTAASAQTLSWGPTGGGGPGTWDNTTAAWFNGSGAVPWVSGSTAVFGGAAGTVTVNGTVTVGGAAFNTNGYTINGGALALGGTAPEFATNTGVSASVNSSITGSAALVKSGAGTLTFSGAQTYTGTTAVNAGQLVLSNVTGFVSPTTVNSGATLRFTGTAAVAAAAPITLNDGAALENFNPSGTVVLTGAVTSSGNTSINVNTPGTGRGLYLDGGLKGSGTVTINAVNAGNSVALRNNNSTFSGTLVVNGIANATAGAGSGLALGGPGTSNALINANVVLNGTIELADQGFGSGFLTSAFNMGALSGNGIIVANRQPSGNFGSTIILGNTNDSGVFSGRIVRGSGRTNVLGITKVGTGTQTLSGANSYTGPTKISGGVLSTPLIANGGVVSGIGASGNAAANLVLDGGILQYTGTGASTDRQFTLTTRGGSLEASGSGALNFTNTAPIALSGAGARALTLTGSNTAANTLRAALADSGGASSLIKAGAGRWVLAGNNAYTGGTFLNGGTLAVANDGNLGAASGALTFNGGTLENTSTFATSRSATLNSGGGTFQTNADLTVSGAIGGVGALTKTGGTTLVLTGNNTYGGGTTIAAGTLQIGDGGTTGAIIGDVTNNGALVFDRSDTHIFGGAISGGGVVNQIGSGTTVLTGNSIYTGGTTISAGILQLGNGGTSGSVTGDIVNNGMLALNRADTTTLDGVISGIGTVNQIGTGITVLTGNNRYAGATDVAGGSLIVNGDQSAATGLTSVQSGATIGGIGTIGGAATIANGGTLNPGNPGAVPGTLAVNGDLTLNAGTTLNYDFGQANVVGGAFNDLTKVGGNLALAGTLNVQTTPGAAFSPGVYRVIDYSGALTNNGFAIGTIPSPNFFLQTSVANQVNLINTAGLTLRFWDGAGSSSTKNDSVIQGGNGVWQNASGNDFWTNKDGTPNAPFTDSAFAVFQGAPGTVTVDNSLGQVLASGMQFATSGYHLLGNPIELTGAPQSIVRVGDGTIDGAAYAVTVDNALTGNTQLVKTDLGTLALNGNNTYAGGTVIQGGTVRIASDTNLGAATGGLTLDGGTLQTTANIITARNISLASTGTLLTDQDTTLTLSGSLAGTGSLTKAGAGTLLLTGMGSQTGATIVAAGTLQTGAENVLSTASAMTVQSGATLNLDGFAQSISSLTNAGTVALSTTPGTVLTVSGNYTGAGGVVRLNTALGDDNSQTDRLVVKGDTAGNTTLRVSNVSGAGAQTVNGIQVVTVNGVSNGTFALQGDYVIGGQQAIIGGAYAYTLQKNGIATPNDGNWYLRSSLVNGQTSSPTVSDPLIYQPGAPLYEAYPQVLLGLNGLPTLQQRVGNLYWSNVTSVRASNAGAPSQLSGLWARIEGQHEAVNPGTSTTGTRWTADQMKLQMGLDGLLVDRDAGRLFAGFTAQYSRASNDIKSFFGNGNLGVNGYSIGGTATWSASNDFYIDAQAKVTWYDSDLKSSTLGQRIVNGNKGFGRAFGVEAGQRLALNGTWSVTPQAQIVYSSVRFDGFTDPFAARVNPDKGESLTSRLGVSLDHNDVWNNGMGHVVRGTFYGIANLYYEFMGDTRVNVSGVPLSAQGDRLWGGLGVGGSVSWKEDRYALYGELLAKTSLANPGRSYGYQGTVGIRMKW
ncbi:autotransporter outer membrane beta-barrel domain-containing protein [Cupriavidus nantongensis]|uniref:autotransporter outer membrane beta-barrel domain-containing protein n=1 Tax=Cupriavidus nantongensis TaxID=1796606 RepID=UPI0022466152|nr:autotransporter outer membrane beta-barrel domain-containing protein [Cupriavidus nantongensis]